VTASLVIIKSNEYVVLASDSLVVDLNGKSLRTQCKILQAGEFVFLPNQFVEFGATGYNLATIAKTIPPQRTLESLAHKFREAVPPPLVRALEARRKLNPERFKVDFDRKQAMGITLVGVEDEQVRLIDLKFFMTDLEAETLEIDSDSTSCPGSDIPSGFGEIFVGDDYTKEVFKAELEDYMLGDSDRVASNCAMYVRMAISHGRSNAGPPISVLKMTPNGFGFLETV
jgi:hypothetical protein